MSESGRADAGRVDDVIGAVVRHIRSNDLGPGDRLPSETSLSKELNVSRAAVREAFRALAAMRIIDIATGRRAQVAEIDHGAMSLMIEHGVRTQQITIQQIYDVRRTIESRIVTLAAIRRSETQAADLRALAAAMRAAADRPDEMMEQDLAFHRALASACRNPVFALIVGAFQGVSRQVWPMGWKSRTTAAAREAMIANHEEIATAIAAGDPLRAVAAMERHFDESLRALQQAGMG